MARLVPSVMVSKKTRSSIVLSGASYCAMAGMGSSAVSFVTKYSSTVLGVVRELDEEYEMRAVASTTVSEASTGQ